MKWILRVTAGAGAGLILGSGRRQFERITRWSKGASQEVGISMAADQVAESARLAGGALHDTSAARSQSRLSDMAHTLSSRLDSAAALTDAGL